MLARAEMLGLGRPLYYGLRLCSDLLASLVPATVIKACPSSPKPFTRWWMGHVFRHALSTAHKPSRSTLSGAAAYTLFLRSHYLRMPLHLLLPHLLTKAWHRCKERWESTQAKQDPQHTP